VLALKSGQLRNEVFHHSHDSHVHRKRGPRLHPYWSAQDALAASSPTPWRCRRLQNNPGIHPLHHRLVYRTTYCSNEMSIEGHCIEDLALEHIGKPPRKSQVHRDDIRFALQYAANMISVRSCRLRKGAFSDWWDTSGMVDRRRIYCTDHAG
jgi:hypothetical protein